jgi:hypothetical protein
LAATTLSWHTPLLIVLLIFVQDSDAIEAARNCKLPDAILSLDGLTSEWATTSTERLDSCAKSTGIPTATQVRSWRHLALNISFALLLSGQVVCWQVCSTANQVGW